MRTFHLSTFATLLTSAALIQVVSLPLHAVDVDSRIEASAKSSYNFKTTLKEDKIQVASSNGMVILTGIVSEDYHRTLAEETVIGLPGVKGVDNQLTVAGEQPVEKSDGWISMKVKTTLTFHKNVKATSTGVHTQDGIVTLSGTADSEAQKQLTTEYVKEVDGVKEVRNDLVVTTPPKSMRATLGEKVDDASITAQIKSSLLFHKSTHAVATKVVTKNGSVSLRGEAQNAAERDLVTKLAEDINGVQHVNNLMTIRKS